MKTISIKERPVLWDMLRFSFPVLLMALLQLLLISTDAFTVSRALGDRGLAAVTNPIYIIYMFLGVVIAMCASARWYLRRAYQAQRFEEFRSDGRQMFITALIGGLIMIPVGAIVAGPLLTMISTPSAIFGLSQSYLMITLCGSLGVLYFAAAHAVLSAAGQKQTVFLFYCVMFCLNVLLDVLFVNMFGLGTAGAAWATVVSQLICGIGMRLYLSETSSDCRITFRRVKFAGLFLKPVFQSGLAGSLEFILICFANILMQASINTFPVAAIAGNGASVILENLFIMPSLAIATSIQTFVQNNDHPGSSQRIRKGEKAAIWMSFAFALGLGILCVIFSSGLIGIFTASKAALDYGMTRTWICGLFFWALALTYTFSAIFRGAGRSWLSIGCCLVYWCALRIGLLAIFLPLSRSFALISWVYPITWLLSALTLGAVYHFDESFSVPKQAATEETEVKEADEEPEQIQPAAKSFEITEKEESDSKKTDIPTAAEAMEKPETPAVPAPAEEPEKPLALSSSDLTAPEEEEEATEDENGLITFRKLDDSSKHD